MTIDYCKYSDCGEREINQDTIGSFEKDDLYFFTLCDGLGGHGGGEIASSLAVSSFLKCAESFGSESKAFFDECFQNANENLKEAIQSKSALKNMKTTATLLSICGSKARWAHIGDSRIYYFKKNKFIKRTADHSIPQMLVATGEIKEKEIRHHVDRNKLLKCLPSEDNRYEILDEIIEVEKGDAFVMMSDGFWDWIDSKDLRKSLKKNKTAKSAVDSLVETAFHRGKGTHMDNLSIILIKIG